MNDIMKTARAAYKLPAVSLILLFAFSCFLPSKIKVPIDTVYYQAPEAANELLFVFLPGNGEDLSTFERHGLIQAVRQRNLSVDMVTVDAYLSYYMNGSIITRLKNDVIEPAKARGYKKIWLVGNSLGGFGSLMYVRNYPNDITGVVLLGPFLGEKRTVNKIEAAGGLQKWDPGLVPINSEEGWEKQLWRWLKDRQQQRDFWHWVKDCEQAEGCFPDIYLGYGTRDRYSYGQKLLAEILPPDHVVTMDGGHKWQVWTVLWDILLDKIMLRNAGPLLEAHVP